jgi:hypothetical protein
MITKDQMHSWLEEIAASDPTKVAQCHYLRSGDIYGGDLRGPFRPDFSSDAEFDAAIAEWEELLANVVPECIAGRVFIEKLGVSPLDLLAFEGKSASLAFDALAKQQAEQGALGLLDLWQEVQDRNVPWGQIEFTRSMK